MLDRTGALPWVYDDGGRAAAGWRGTTGDCVCRSISIAAGLHYTEVYETLGAFIAGYERKSKRRPTKSSPRTGIYEPTVRAFMTTILGWEWVPTMRVGTGTRVHLRGTELPPSGALMVSVSRHYTAVIDGVIRDIYDPSRGGTRCVYGYYRKAG